MVSFIQAHFQDTRQIANENYSHLQECQALLPVDAVQRAFAAGSWLVGPWGCLAVGHARWAEDNKCKATACGTAADSLATWLTGFVANLAVVTAAVVVVMTVGGAVSGNVPYGWDALPPGAGG